MCRLFVSLAIAAGFLAGAPAALADQGSSSNWAGYAVHGALFHRISAAWRQPAVACLPGQDTYSAYWVGLGGYSGNALEQIGTEADCSASGQATLSAWYEMVPAASVPVTMTVASGDQMSAQVTVIGHHATLVLNDLTRHEGFRTTVGSPYIDVTSAEWIVEAPSDCLSTCTTLPLANFGSTVFTQARAQSAGGHWGTISDRAWSTTEISLSPTGGHLAAAGHGPGAAVPSTLSAGGSTFGVSYTTGAAAHSSRHARLSRQLVRLAARRSGLGPLVWR